MVAGTTVVATVAALFVLRPDWVASADNRTCDVVAGWAGHGVPSGRVAVVEIDEPSLAQYGRWPWPRDLLGRLLKGAGSAGAAVVAMDVILSEEDRKDRDEAVAQAMARVPTVVGYAMRFDGGSGIQAGCHPAPLPLVVVGPAGGSDPAFFHATGMNCTVASIAQASAGSGFLNAAPDRDGRLRVLPMVMQEDGNYYPSLALAAMNVYGRVSRMQLHENARGAEWLRLGDRVEPLEGRSWMRLRYRGGRRVFPYVSAAQVLEGNVAGNMLRDKIVVVGASAPGLESTVVTPVDSLFPAVELQATAIDNLLQGDALRRPGGGYFWEVLLALLMGAASVLGLATIRSLWGGAVTVALATAVWIVCLVAAKEGVLLSPLAATCVLGCNLVMLTLLNYRLERKRAEASERELHSAEERAVEARQQSESRYQTLVENVNDAIITTDLEGRLVFANRRFREWFGLGDRDVRGLALEDCVAPDWRPAVREQHGRLAAGAEETGQLEYEGIRADGTRIWIEALISTLREGGRINGTQSALRDVTERKRLEAEYLQSQKMESVGRLAGGVAHDFNNLLTVINGYSELLAGKLGGGDMGDMVLQIHRAGLRAAELTAQLLTFSRKQVVQARPMDLNAVVEEAHRMLQRLVGEDVELVMGLDAGLWKVQADPGQMQQVLMNLVVNSRDSMAEGGRLTIDTANVHADEEFVRMNPEVPVGRYVRLAVTDTGVGMTEEVRKRIFEPFFTTKEKGKGTGLGLATVYGIVRQCGGNIVVESRPGAGARFEIYLPRTEPAVEAVGMPAEPAARRGWETVLLVEDQAAVRQLTEDMLRAHGYKVLAAANGAAAMAQADRHRGTIHLLITDVILPHMNGRVLAESLKSGRPDLKVLYISGYSDEIVARQGVLDGGVAYLAKPYSAEVLAAKVREVLEEKGSGAGG